MFTGFTPQTAEFLWGIRFNNEKSWFEANKAAYLAQVQQPLRELGEALYAWAEESCPQLRLNLHVSRIYRDARRLFGRGPYKDHMWLSLRPESEAWVSRPVFYFELMPEGCSYGMGFYSATPGTMERFRQATAADPRPMSTLARSLKRRGEFQLVGERYARPKPAPSPLLEPWMNCKRFSLECDLPYDGEVFTPALVDRVRDGFAYLVPFYRHFLPFCREEG